MEILYIWVDDFRSIKKQGFNFGGEYSFDFNQESGELFCYENELYIKDFYGAKVNNVSAIIGENGSGKSTLLDFIKLNIAVDIGNTVLNFLCLYKQKNEPDIFVYNSTRQKLKLPKRKESLFTLTDEGLINGKLVSLTYPTAFIYYSPIIDFNYNQEYLPLDISTTRLLKDTEATLHRNYTNSLHELARNEMKEQLLLASSQHRELLPFDLPEELHMNPNPLREEYITQKIDLTKDSFISQFNTYDKIIKDDIYEKRGKREQQYVEIYSSLFWHTISYLLSHKTKLQNLFINPESSFVPSSNDPTWELLEFVYTRDSLKNILPDWLIVKFFFKQLRLLEKDETMYYFFARFNFEIRPIENYEKVDSLLNTYYKLSVVGDFLHFYWSGLSTGQQSLFSIFSRFYNCQSKIKSFSEGKNDSRVNVHSMTPYTGIPDVVVLIDEGEVNLHPQWQKEFIYTLTKYLPDIIGVPKIQLIMASNSPFLISDLPHYNVIFLNQKNNKTLVKENNTTTFAANIHELLAQSFFLDGTIGKVAETKINEVIDLLNQDQDISPSQIDYIKKFIRLVDDPFVQDKLLQMFSLKVKTENWEEYMLEQQQKIIEEKLYNIRKGKNDA